MKLQRSMFLIKEQDNTSEELSEVEIITLPDKELNVMIKEYRGKMNEHSKYLKS